MDTQTARPGYRFNPGSARSIRKQGTWLRDEAGRYVLLRGVNLGSRSKWAPYLPLYPLDQKVASADPAVFAAELARVRPRLLAMARELGVNVLRLLVTWKGVEPEPGPEPGRLTPAGTAYLDRIGDFIAELQGLGIHVFVDFHQDLAHELYGGDGFPDWALAVDAGHPRPEQPPAPNVRWGLNYYQPLLGFLAPLGKLVRHTLRSFWENKLTNERLHDYPVRDHFVRTFGAAAGYFMGRPEARAGILGYEPFNEPHQVGLQDRHFEGKVLPDFYGDAFRALRAVDPDALLFAEPRVDWTVFSLDGPEFLYLLHTDAPETVLALSDEADAGLVFSYHYYDPRLLEVAARELAILKLLSGYALQSKEKEWTRVFDLMRKAATSRGMVPFLTEFGASQWWEPPKFETGLRDEVFQGSQAAAYMGLQLEQVERQLLNATYWNADFYNTREEGDYWNTENFSIVAPDWSFRHAGVFARPYPMRSTAQPELLWFQLSSEHAALVLKGKPVSAALPTVVFVPRAHHWFRGFEVRVSVGEDVRVEWDAERSLLYWWLDPEATEHVLSLGPRQSFDPGRLPTRAQQLLASAARVLEVL